jgi:hypothetical protein
MRIAGEMIEEDTEEKANCSGDMKKAVCTAE